MQTNSTRVDDEGAVNADSPEPGAAAKDRSPVFSSDRARSTNCAFDFESQLRRQAPFPFFASRTIRLMINLPFCPDNPIPARVSGIFAKGLFSSGTTGNYFPGAGKI